MSIWTDKASQATAWITKIWLLATGRWNDAEYWDDREPWRDGPFLWEDRERQETIWEDQ